MTAARNYRKVSVEIRAAAVKHVHTLVDEGVSETEACRAVSAQIGVHWNSVRNWLRDEDGRATGATPTPLRRQIAELRVQRAAAGQLNRELADLNGDLIERLRRYEGIRRLS